MGKNQHRIEIDEDVMSHLKQHAEPFEDTPNSVLRRLLLREGEKSADTSRSSGAREEVPRPVFGVPRALAQTLDVIRLVRLRGGTRSDATHEVAEREGVAFQTVLDKYSRQLGLRASQFDKFLTEPDLASLRRRLKSRFADHDTYIDEVLSPVFGEARANAN